MTTQRVEPDVFTYKQRVRPQECSPTGFLGHPRFLEFFEAAFIECWRARFGALHEALGANRQLVVTDVNLQIQDGVARDEELQVDVALEDIEEVSIRVHYDASVRGAKVAEGTVRYVCLDIATGRPTAYRAHPDERWMHNGDDFGEDSAS